MARGDGVRTVKAAPEGLFAVADNRGTRTAFVVPWEQVPYDVRQHLAEVYRYLNEEHGKRVEHLAIHVRDERIHQADRKEWGL
jgi:hypothetical protein